MNAVVCADRNWAIGKEGRLLFHIPADLKKFKELTWGGSLLMGRRTFDSLPGPLPGRAHFVLSRDPGFAPAGAAVLRSLEEAKALADSMPGLWLVGGAQLFTSLLPYCNQAYVTRVNAAIIGADAFFPNIDALPQWRCIKEGPWLYQGELKFRFCRYQNALPL